MVFEPFNEIITPLRDSKVEEKVQTTLYLQPFKVDLSTALPESSRKFVHKESISPKYTLSKIKSSEWKKVLKKTKLDYPEK